MTYCGLHVDMPSFNHVTVFQADAIQRAREQFADSTLFTHKHLPEWLAKTGITLEQLHGFTRRNPRPQRDAA